jgi:uncharacterized protein (TIGR02569 family)
MRPGNRVVEAFGGTEPVTPLAGGRGTAWRAGAVVLKPLDLAREELEWQAAVLGGLSDAAVRLSRPLRASSGELVVGGWTAWELVAGRHEPRRWAEIIAAGDRFHDLVADVPRPGFIDQRSHQWAIADRVAWGELPAADYVDAKHLAQLVATRRPVRAASSLIHGDLTGNVLFADGLAPAVIDISPYWRPRGLATAVVIADALVWEGAPDEVVDAGGGVDELGQLLLRALISRVVADHLVRCNQPGRPDDDDDPYLRPVELACALAGG